MYVLINTMVLETSIRLHTKTVEELKKVKITPRESYDEIINRLIDNSG